MFLAFLFLSKESRFNTFAVLLNGLIRVVPNVKSEPLRKNFLLFIIKSFAKGKNYGGKIACSNIISGLINTQAGLQDTRTKRCCKFLTKVMHIITDNFFPINTVAASQDLPLQYEGKNSADCKKSRF